MELLAEAAPGTYYTFVFAFGAVWGSFLNVVIARLPEGLSVVSPPSRCPRCQKQIAWYDNVPILSWLWLRAKCRGCGLPISGRYPLVEALTGLLAIALAFRLGPTFLSLAAFVFVLLLVALSFIDLDHFWLPEQLSLPLLGLGLLSPLWNPDLGATLAAFNLVPGPPLLQAFASSWGGALIGAGVLWSVGLLGKVVFKKEAMGLGDVVLLAGIGAWLGVQALFFVVMFASMQGALLGVVMILRRPKTQAPALPPPAAAEAVLASAAVDNQSVNETQPAVEGEEEWKPDPHHVPFGPFLALAAVEQLLAGDAIWSGWMGVMNHLWDWIDKLLGRA